MTGSTFDLIVECPTTASDMTFSEDSFVDPALTFNLLSESDLSVTLPTLTSLYDGCYTIDWQFIDSLTSIDLLTDADF